MENKITAGVLQVLEWAPRNLEMISIEDIWDYLKTENNRNQTNLTDLWNALQDIWHSIPVRLLQPYSRSNGKRVVAQKKVKGRHTKY